MRTSYYNQLERIAPYPVVNYEENPKYGGRFVYGDKPVIKIAPYMKTPAIRVAILVHEIGHAIHYKRGCKCMDEWELSELHAHRFALRFMLRYKFVTALRYTIRHTINGMPHFPRYYVTAFEQLQTEKIWQKCLDFLENR